MVRPKEQILYMNIYIFHFLGNKECQPLWPLTKVDRIAESKIFSVNYVYEYIWNIINQDHLLMIICFNNFEQEHKVIGNKFYELIRN